MKKWAFNKISFLFSLVPLNKTNSIVIQHFEKTVISSFLLNISFYLFKNDDLNDYLFRPLRAGIFGFLTVVLILFMGELFSSVLGANKLIFNSLDISLASTGFFLKYAEKLLKNLLMHQNNSRNN